ncbi:MAG: hypothetical protein KDD55_05070, partial [Bdellovibrionales bacterium]|nr:hypothetical protein [Bdellovibrionales bacterium]
LLIGGFVFWVLFALPLSLLTIAPETLGTLALFLLMPAIILSLRFYFYFFPILIGHTSPKTILGEASEYTKFDSFLGLKALIGPLGFMLVIVASIRSFSSEETNLLLTLTVEYLSTIFPLLTIYLGMSFCLTLLPEKKWSAYGLTPYHRERFETLRVNSPKWLSNILRPQTGLFFLVIGSLLWLSNDLRTSQMPPSAKIQVLSVSAKDSSLTLELSIDGEKDANTLSFHPGSLRLAAEKGSNISQQVPEILFQGEKLPFGARLDDIIHGEETKTSLPVILTVTFETQLSEKELTKLGDMYLWYRNYRMDHILVPTEELPSKDGA